MEIRQGVTEGVAVVELAGEFDADSLPAVSEAVAESLEASPKGLVLNVRRVAIVSSSAIGYMIKVAKHLESDGGRLLIADPPAWFSRNLDMLGMAETLRMYPDDETAIAALSDA